MSDKAPQLDPHALGAAELAYLGADSATPAARVRAAIRAYLWALDKDMYSMVDVQEALR